jgi:hypothetical protein
VQERVRLIRTGKNSSAREDGEPDGFDDVYVESGRQTLQSGFLGGGDEETGKM